MTQLCNNQQKKKKRSCRIVEFAVPADHRVKMKEIKKNKNLDLTRELEKLWNMKVTVMSIIIGALVQSPKDWHKDWVT